MQLNSTLLSALHCLLKVGQRPGGRACESVSLGSSHKCHLLQIANTNCHLRSPTQPTSSKKVQDKIPRTWRDDTNRNFLFSSPTSLFPQVARCHLTPSRVQLSHWVFMSSLLTIETPLISFNVDICSKKYVCNRCTFSAFFVHFLQVIVKVTVSLSN